jgi:hypothetical protein
MHPQMIACGVLPKHRLAHPKMAHMAKKPDLRHLKVGKGAQRRITEQEMAEREAVANLPSGTRPRRVTPLKITL